MFAIRFTDTHFFSNPASQLLDLAPPHLLTGRSPYSPTLVVGKCLPGYSETLGQQKAPWGS